MAIPSTPTGRGPPLPSNCYIWMQPFFVGSIDGVGAQLRRSRGFHTVRRSKQRLFRAHVDGKTMDIGLNRSDLTGLAGIARVAGGGGFSGRPEKSTIKTIRSRFVWLPVVMIAGVGAWVLLSGNASKSSESEPASPAAAAASEPAPSPATDAAPKESSFDPATTEAITSVQTAPVDGLKISSQSWRRGGLGSKALVTFTLRNLNDYAVKDIEISCAFARRDGSHLTDRTRIIHGTVNMKSRRIFVRMHVGFVNVNANKAKCSLVAASRI
jgi:hypothetical protein